MTSTERQRAAAANARSHVRLPTSPTLRSEYFRQLRKRRDYKDALNEVLEWVTYCITHGDIELFHIIANRYALRRSFESQEFYYHLMEEMQADLIKALHEEYPEYPHLSDMDLIRAAFKNGLT